jgi:transposase-like protein
MIVLKIAHFAKNPKKIYQLIRKKRWKNGVYCPRCGVFDVKRHQLLPSGLQKYRCGLCNMIFSDLKGTIFEATKLPIEKWFVAIYEFSFQKGMSIDELKDRISVNKNTAHRILGLLRKAIYLDNLTITLEGEVELDESYHGGRRKGNRGRDIRWSNKICVAGAIERGKRTQAKIKVLTHIDENELTGFAGKNIREGSVTYTDEYGGYCGLNYAGFHHRTINHSQYFSQGDIHTNTIEGFWSYLKRKIRGKHHSSSPENLVFYLNDYVFRFNQRHLSKTRLMTRIFNLSLNTRAY